MSISALSSSSATSQLSFLNRLSSTNSASSTQSVRPPPPPDGSGFADAIAEALKAIGISDSSVDGGTTTAASTDAETTDTTDVATALGSFLQSLMGALHAQNTESAEAPPPYGEQQGNGGPGKLQSDLQSLLSKLTSGAVDASADGDDAVGELESSFANLLDKLGGGASTSGTDDSGSTDAAAKLAAFLQALSTKVGGSGSSGNLVNTTV